MPIRQHAPPGRRPDGPRGRSAAAHAAFANLQAWLMSRPMFEQIGFRRFAEYRVFAHPA